MWWRNRWRRLRCFVDNVGVSEGGISGVGLESVLVLGGGCNVGIVVAFVLALALTDVFDGRSWHWGSLGEWLSGGRRRRGSPS